MHTSATPSQSSMQPQRIRTGQKLWRSNVQELAVSWRKHHAKITKSQRVLSSMPTMFPQSQNILAFAWNVVKQMRYKKETPTHMSVLDTPSSDTLRVDRAIDTCQRGGKERSIRKLQQRRKLLLRKERTLVTLRESEMPLFVRYVIWFPIVCNGITVSFHHERLTRWAQGIQTAHSWFYKEFTNCRSTIVQRISRNWISVQHLESFWWTEAPRKDTPDSCTTPREQPVRPTGMVESLWGDQAMNEQWVPWECLRHLLLR